MVIVMTLRETDYWPQFDEDEDDVDVDEDKDDDDDDDGDDDEGGEGVLKMGGKTQLTI